MHYFKNLFLLIFFTVLSFAACETNPSDTKPTLDADAIIKIMPANIDTTNIVIDNAGNTLTFRQYIPIVFNNEGMIYRDREVFRLQLFTKAALNSLERDDYAIARGYRWEGVRAKDTPKTNKEKFAEIAATFSMADRIVVFKARRVMSLQRKGKEIVQFKINLGRNPVGDKIMEGDNRTPQGVYHVENKWNRSDKYYKSFWISYPDSADKAEARKKNVKPGVGVMIHGTRPDRVNAKDWTNGCIALSNKDMDTLFKYVIEGTVIDIRK